MHRALALTAALVAASVSLITQPASAEPLLSEPCSMSTSGPIDPPEAAFQTGTVEGGPVYGDVTAGPFSIRCSVQVGNDNPLYQDATSVTGEPGYPATLPRTDITFYADPFAPVFLCTEYLYVGRAPEYHDADPYQPGVQCDEAERKQDGPNSQSYEVRDQWCISSPVTDPVTRPCFPAPPDLCPLLDPCWSEPPRLPMMGR